MWAQRHRRAGHAAHRDHRALTDAPAAPGRARLKVNMRDLPRRADQPAPAAPPPTTAACSGRCGASPAKPTQVLSRHSPVPNHGYPPRRWPCANGSLREIRARRLKSGSCGNSSYESKEGVGEKSPCPKAGATGSRIGGSLRRMQVFLCARHSVPIRGRAVELLSVWTASSEPART